MGTNKSNKNIYSASEVSKYLIFLSSQKVIGDDGEREGITNLKLQKILYLAQAYYLAKYNKPIFSDEIEAWQYGPVIPSVYKKMKKYGRDSITSIKDSSKITKEDKEILNRVWEAFGGYSAGKLVDITHSHSPWKDAYDNKSKIISREKITEYYKSLFKN